MVIPRFQQMMVPVRGEPTYAPTNRAMKATPAFERGDALLISPAPVNLTEWKTKLQSTNTHNHIYIPQVCNKG